MKVAVIVAVIFYLVIPGVAIAFWIKWLKQECGYSTREALTCCWDDIKELYSKFREQDSSMRKLLIFLYLLYPVMVVMLTVSICMESFFQELFGGIKNGIVNLISKLTRRK